MAHTVTAYIAMAYIVTAYTFMVCTVVPYVAVAYIVVAYLAMTYIVVVYIVMAPIALLYFPPDLRAFLAAVLGLPSDPAAPLLRSRAARLAASAPASPR